MSEEAISPPPLPTSRSHEDTVSELRLTETFSALLLIKMKKGVLKSGVLGNITQRVGHFPPTVMFAGNVVKRLLPVDAPVE